MSLHGPPDHQQAGGGDGHAVVDPVQGLHQHTVHVHREPLQRHTHRQAVPRAVSQTAHWEPGGHSVTWVYQENWLHSDDTLPNIHFNVGRLKSGRRECRRGRGESVGARQEGECVGARLEGESVGG